MSKSILIIDTPSNCEECELLQHANFCYTGKDVNCYREDGKPKWCPLRPLPPKLDANDWHRMFSGLFSEREAKGYGWNACLDVITGETE